MGNFFSPFGTFDFMFNLFPIMFLFVFAIVIYTFIKSIAESMHNKRQPVIPVETKIVSKRYNVSHHRHNTETAITIQAAALIII